MSLGPIAALLAAAVAWLVLAVAGLGSWRRTGPVRGGVRPAHGPRVVDVPTSGITLAPAACALAVTACGVALPQAALAAIGAGIMVLALVARVTGLRIDGDGLTIRYRARPAFAVAWSECVAVDPPRWPLGGWTIHGLVEDRVRGRILMPSDLLGAEDVLGLVVVRAGLRFDGRRWIRRTT